MGVKKMMEELREELEQTDASIGQAFKSLDLDGDGVLSYDEVLLAMEQINFEKRPGAAQFKELLKQLDPDEDGKITLKDIHKLVVDMEFEDDDAPLVDSQSAASKAAKAGTVQ